MIYRVSVWMAVWRGLFGAYMRRKPLMVGTQMVGLAHGDGESDDTRHLQRAMDRARGATLEMGPGSFAITGPLTLRNAHIKGVPEKCALIMRGHDLELHNISVFGAGTALQVEP